MDMKSFHKRRLVVNLDLFKEGEYLISTKDYELLELPARNSRKLEG